GEGKTIAWLPPPAVPMMAWASSGAANTASTARRARPRKSPLTKVLRMKNSFSGPTPREENRVPKKAARGNLNGRETWAGLYRRAGMHVNSYRLLRDPGSEAEHEPDPRRARLDRVEVDVLDPARGLARETRGVEVVDVRDLCVEYVEDLELGAQPSHDLVT